MRKPKFKGRGLKITHLAVIPIPRHYDCQRGRFSLSAHLRLWTPREEGGGAQSEGVAILLRQEQQRVFVGQVPQGIEKLLVFYEFNRFNLFKLQLCIK